MLILKNNLKQIINKWRLKNKELEESDNTENKTGISLTRISFLLYSISIIAVTFLLSVLILVFTSFKMYLPGYSDVLNTIIQSNLELDSLYEKSIQTDIYIENLRRILTSDISYDSKSDIKIPKDSLIVISSEILSERTQVELDFIKSFEDEEKYNLSELITQKAAEGLVFITPVKGVIRRDKDLNQDQTSLDILCAKNALISSPLEGVILNACYSIKDKNQVIILHKNNFISIFKNIVSLRKYSGDKVRAGEIIGIMSSKNYDENQPVLNYELWHNKNKVDPEEYINF